MQPFRLPWQRSRCFLWKVSGARGCFSTDISATPGRVSASPMRSLDMIYFYESFVSGSDFCALFRDSALSAIRDSTADTCSSGCLRKTLERIPHLSSFKWSQLLKSIFVLFPGAVLSRAPLNPTAAVAIHPVLSLSSSRQRGVQVLLASTTIETTLGNSRG